jgi:hypothetical protein
VAHPLTSTSACNVADAMALEKARFGEGAKVVDVRRKAWDSYDLAYVVQGANGDHTDVVVTNAALKRRMTAATA